MHREKTEVKFRLGLTEVYTYWKASYYVADVVFTCFLSPGHRSMHPNWLQRNQHVNMYKDISIYIYINTYMCYVSAGLFTMECLSSQMVSTGC